MKIRSFDNQLELFQLFKPINDLFLEPKFTFVDLFSGIGTTSSYLVKLRQVTGLGSRQPMSLFTIRRGLIICQGKCFLLSLAN